MTLRTTAEQDLAIGRLAAHWGVSRAQAVARAIDYADQRLTRTERIEALAQEALADWPETLSRLGRE